VTPCPANTAKDPTPEAAFPTSGSFAVFAAQDDTVDDSRMGRGQNSRRLAVSWSGAESRASRTRF
jgi:hypothetical protein